MKKLFYLLSVMLFTFSLISCDEILGNYDNPVSGGTSSSDDSEIIVFKDSYVEGLLAQYFDKNNDYKISMAEAKSVVDFQNIFKENEHITSFDELQYFTRLKFINKEAFKGCINLQSITIPGSVETLEKKTFENCFNLENVTLQEGLKKLSEMTFYGCRKLKKLIIPASVNEIDKNFLYYSNSYLNVIVVEKGNNIYDSREDCNCIIETASNKIIKGSSNSLIPSSIKIIGKDAFQDVKGLSNLIIPEGIEIIEENAFYNTDLSEITIPLSVVKIGSNSFGIYGTLTKVTMQNPIPPTIDLYCFGDLSKDNFSIYVPSGSVDAYKTASYWSDYAKYIKAIE